jgi:hypothetical protein
MSKATGALLTQAAAPEIPSGLPMPQAVATPCPVWCTQQHAIEELHQAALKVVHVSGDGGRNLDADDVKVEVHQARTPAELVTVADRPLVSLHAEGNTGNFGMTTMTPAEAMALAVALAQAAWNAQSGAAAEPSVAPGDCPPWCEIAGDHEDEDGGRMQHVLCESIGLDAYPYVVQGEQYAESMNVSRQQVRGGVPVLMIERPEGDVEDPDEITSGCPAVGARQILLSTGEAVDLATVLLGLVSDPASMLPPSQGNAR